MKPRYLALCVVAVLGLTLFGPVRSSSLVLPDVLARIQPWLAPWPYVLIDVLSNTAVVLALVLGLRAAARRLDRTFREKVSPRSSAEGRVFALAGDRPATTQESDSLGTYEFATELSRYLLLPQGAPSVVIGLEGPWGCGKSSCALMALDVIRRDPRNPVIVQFRPWLVEGRTEIVSAFFQSLIDSFAESGSRQVIRHLADFALKVDHEARVFSGASLLLISALRNWLGKPELASPDRLKARIEKGISDLNRPVVILVDDVDRLPPDDARTVVHLLRALADFERCAYIVPYDKQILGRLLGFDPSGEMRERYEEKFVQVTLQFPNIPLTRKVSALQAELERIAHANQIGLEGEDAERLRRAVLLSVRILVTPRQVKRSLSGAVALFSRLQGEVCLPDLVVFEAMRVVFPQVVAFIAKQPSSVGAVERGDHELSPETLFAEAVTARLARSGGRSETWIDNLLAQSPHGGDSLRACIEFLFGDEKGERRLPMAVSAARRVAEADTLLKVLYRGTAEFMFSVSEGRAFLAAQADRGAVLSDCAASLRLAAWIYHVSGLVGDSIPADPVGLLNACVAASKSVTDSQEPDLFPALSRLGVSVLASLGDPESRADLLSRLIDNQGAYELSETLLLFELQGAGMWSSGTYSPSGGLPVRGNTSLRPIGVSLLQRLTEMWVGCVRAVPIGEIISSAPNALSVLFRLVQLDPAGVERTQLDIENAIVGSRHVAVAFLEKFRVRAHSLAGLEQLLTESSKAALSQVIDEVGLSASIRGEFTAMGI